MDAHNLILSHHLQWTPGKSDMVRSNIITEFVGRNKKVLDIGCYDGFIGELIKREGNDVYGIDGSDEAINMAKDRGIKTYKINIETEEFPFLEGEFDVVVAGEIIEHIYDTDTFLEKINRLLKPGGILILTTPNLAALGRRLMLLLGMNPFMEVSSRKTLTGHVKRFFMPGTENDVAGGHIRYFVKENLLTLIESYGFKVLCVRSDVVNFNKSGTLSSMILARIFPILGKSLIVKAEKI